MLIQQLLNGLMIGGMYALVAVGFTLIFGLLRMLNLAQGEVFMISGFMVIGAMTTLNAPPLVAALIGILLAGVLSVGIELVCFRLVNKQYEVAPFVSTLGMGMVLTNIAVNLTGSEGRFFPLKIDLPDLQVWDLLIPTSQVLMVAVAIGTMVGLTVLMRRSRIGRAMRASAVQPQMAELLGVNTAAVVRAGFFAAGALAGIAGILFGLRYGQITPFISGTLGLKALAATIIGGMDNVTGTGVVAVAVGVMEAMGMAYLSAVWAEMAIWLLAILVLVYRPTGLFGKALVEKI